jgi:tRNA pseudouridine32 synthase/23S rRNA pseudouridine746 synthase
VTTSRAIRVDPLYESETLVAVSKVPGEPVIAERGATPEACLRRRLERERGERLWVVHRIDRDASGLVVFAHDAETHRALSLAFEHRRARKTYVAYVRAPLVPARGTIDSALHAARRGKTRPARPGEPGSQKAVTDYVVVKTWRRGDAAVSRLEVRPHTGRHHQIRVHMRSADAPLLFDPLYGRRLQPPDLEEAPCQRLALHALRLTLPSPRGGKERGLTLEAPLAQDLVDLEAWLDRTWASA